MLFSRLYGVSSAWLRLKKEHVLTVLQLLIRTGNKDRQRTYPKKETDMSAFAKLPRDRGTSKISLRLQRLSLYDLGATYLHVTCCKNDSCCKFCLSIKCRLTAAVLIGISLQSDVSCSANLTSGRSIRPHCRVVASPGRALSTCPTPQIYDIPT